MMRIKKDSSTGYVLEVDLEYPEKLHDIMITHQHQKKLAYQKNGCLNIVKKLQMHIILLQEQLKNQYQI